MYRRAGNIFSMKTYSLRLEVPAWITYLVEFDATLNNIVSSTEQRKQQSLRTN